MIPEAGAATSGCRPGPVWAQEDMSPSANGGSSGGSRGVGGVPSCLAPDLA